VSDFEKLLQDNDLADANERMRRLLPLLEAGQAMRDVCIYGEEKETAYGWQAWDAAKQAALGAGAGEKP
jgi:hypothetical protein